MENIRQAVERAKAPLERLRRDTPEPARQQVGLGFSAPHVKDLNQEVALDVSHLQSNQIVAYDGTDLRSRPFDVLRTEILQAMDQNGWKTLAITSPTPGCGKTLISANLALSIGRQSERQVFLADLDLRRPHVANSLGIKCRDGAVGVIEGRIDLGDALVRARAGSSRLTVLPTVAASNSSDLVDSSAMKLLLEDIRSAGQLRIAVLDLPPLLTGHDVISILPQVDCVLLIAAAGTSKVSEIEQCNKYLQGTEVVQFVLNKAPEASTAYGIYY